MYTIIPGDKYNEEFVFSLHASFFSVPDNVTRPFSISAQKVGYWIFSIDNQSLSSKQAYHFGQYCFSLSNITYTSST